VSPDLANLLAALRDDPADEVASLALADWCLEQPDAATQARGEYARLSLRAGKLPRGEAQLLREQANAIEKRHRAAWFGPLRQLTHRCDALPGGLTKIDLSDNRLNKARAAGVTVPADLFAWVSEIEMRQMNLDEFAVVAELLPEGFVRSFTGNLSAKGPAAVETLGRCRWLPGLRRLDFRTHGLGDDGAAALARLDALKGLKELNLNCQQFAHDGMAALSSSANLAGLTRFGCHHTPLRLEAWAALSHCTWNDSLRTLALDYCKLGTEGLRALLRPEFAPNLQTLWMRSGDFDAASMEVLASWPGLANLRELRLGDDRLGDAGAAALARSPYLGELRILDLRNGHVGAGGTVALAAAGPHRLETLDLSPSDLGDAAVLALCESPNLASLRQLKHSCRFLQPATYQALEKRFGK
jgi:uncharacterized protein (TIGR02996 family)